MTGSVLFYVQHLLGIGHLRRALHLVDGMARAGFAVTLVSGGEPLPELAGAAAERVIQLPPIRAADASFKNLVGAAGRPVDDALRATRSTALLAAFADAQPDAVLIEAYPFGRRAFRFELERLIAATYALLGLMSFLTAGETEVRAWTIPMNSKAVNAAGAIHSDFEKKFIRAEVVNWQALVDHAGYPGVREKGLLRLEGKDYIVKDGDVLVIRHG